FDVISYDNLESQEIDSLVRIESKCRSLRELVDPEEYYSQSLRFNLDSPFRLNNVEKLQKQGDENIEKRIFPFNGEVLDYQSMGFGRCWLGIDLFLCVEVFKSLPVFGQLSLEDKELLLSHVALTIVTLSRSFYSVAQESPVIVMPDGTMPMLAQIKTGMETEVFCRVIEPILRVGVSVEEYVLLKAILYCSADIYGLSQQGRQLLQAERERYASILMRLMQRRYGPLAGAKKYAEVISLVDTYFHFGLRYRQHCLMINVALKLPKRYALIEDVLRGGNMN
ncbi:Nuclear hormone receptor, partial [Aphelenchoides avenae]